jgi:hypothetical protein
MFFNRNKRRNVIAKVAENNPTPWVIVTSPGMDNEYFWNDYATLKEARKNLKEAKYATGEKCDIMKRLDDGRLTTEY